MFPQTIYATKTSLSLEIYDRGRARDFLQAICLHVIARRDQVESALEWLILNERLHAKDDPPAPA